MGTADVGAGAWGVLLVVLAIAGNAVLLASFRGRSRPSDVRSVAGTPPQQVGAALEGLVRVVTGGWRAAWMRLAVMTLLLFVVVLLLGWVVDAMRLRERPATAMEYLLLMAAFVALAGYDAWQRTRPRDLLIPTADRWFLRNVLIQGFLPLAILLFTPGTAGYWVTAGLMVYAIIALVATLVRAMVLLLERARGTAPVRVDDSRRSAARG